MRIAYSNLACPEWSIEEVFAKAVQFGFDGVEIRLLDGEVISPELDRDVQQRLKRLAVDSGVEMVGIGASTKFATADEGERRQNVKELLQYIELAARLEVPFVRTFGGTFRADHLSDAQAVAYVADALAQVAPRAEALGVAVLLETHDDFSHSSLVRDVVSQVGSSAIGALWDTHHPYRMGETVVETFENLNETLRHVHLKDARRVGDGWQLVAFNQGEVPVREIVQTLVAHGYDGVLCIEWERKWHPEIEAAETALPKHLAILQDYLANLE
ncbi:Sugar phosphate isomerase/epimerase [Alicyclobacillus hesperidum]|uniref:Sugar phosphate isomerase/epimerase n=1 Tax=Alicyclobacillus hesperidum TaxID=89784 RepID=A0A1H2SSA6_9BACL|nr:sugar phosphate isomerase/epimerase family protein [Alicyclobacillus hesperidum]SDW34543.1 Sugar phosphate isomerase/epimerase [Alicyclobacillus hesperidum]